MNKTQERRNNKCKSMGQQFRLNTFWRWWSCIYYLCQCEYYPNTGLLLTGRKLRLIGLSHTRRLFSSSVVGAHNTACLSCKLSSTHALWSMLHSVRTRSFRLTLDKWWFILQLILQNKSLYNFEICDIFMSQIRHVLQELINSTLGLC